MHTHKYLYATTIELPLVSTSSNKFPILSSTLKSLSLFHEKKTLTSLMRMLLNLLEGIYFLNTIIVSKTKQKEKQLPTITESDILNEWTPQTILLSLQTQQENERIIQ